jgi:hypothetical protein
MNRMAPKLQVQFGGGGQWQEAVERAVRMDADTPQQLRGMWARNQEAARAHGLTLTPEEFAVMVVDENFPLD